MTEADRVTAQAKADILPTGASSPILLSPTGHQEPGPREEGKKKMLANITCNWIVFLLFFVLVSAKIFFLSSSGN